MSDQYILDGKTPVAVDDHAQWSMWWKTAERAVQKTQVGDVLVSTVFLGIDNRLFETRVFGGSLDGEHDSCLTWDEAVAMHDEMVSRVKENSDE